MNKDHLMDIVRPTGQEHLLAFWDRLDATERESLGKQIEKIDFELVRSLYDARNRQVNLHELAERAERPPALSLDVEKNPYDPHQAHCSAGEALGSGEIGVVLVAGGQGTRLNFDRPKGMFPIGPLSNKSLFQIHVEKIVAAARHYGVSIPLYMMTSPATHAETAAFFAEHDNFGLPAEDVIIFQQGTMPAVDAETGRVLLDAPGRVATSPDGHGGLLPAMLMSGATADIERRGIRHLFYFQVDNPLVDICGREFLGYHLLSKSEFSSQVISKRDPLERVGNVVQVDGRLMVIEYSDLPNDVAARRDPDGALRIWAGSIAVHIIEVGMLRRLAVDAGDALPFHIARKKVSHIDAQGNWIEPSQANAIKFERFIFDLMPHARNAIVVEVDRDLAFAPLKNASGAKEDSPEIVRSKLSALACDWLVKAGAKVAEDLTVEISPLFAMDAEELAAKIPHGLKVTESTYFS